VTVASATPFETEVVRYSHGALTVVVREGLGPPVEDGGARTRYLRALAFETDEAEPAAEFLCAPEWDAFGAVEQGAQIGAARLPVERLERMPEPSAFRARVDTLLELRWPT
jgi:hypothetical protein